MAELGSSFTCVHG